MAKKQEPRFGSHLSVAGGLHKAIATAVELGLDTVQIFTKNNNRWDAKPLLQAEIDHWTRDWKASGMEQPIAHASYLINLASPDDVLWNKSVEAMVVELDRANQLKLEGVVVHPGAFTTGTEEGGMQRIIAGVTAVLGKTSAGSAKLLLENTAGQGSCLGWSLEQLGNLLEGINQPERVGCCLDTCHLFAAGYDLTSAKAFKEMRKKIDGLLPAAAVTAIHINDSKVVCGKRVDRHEHIGRGEIGEEAFRRILHDPFFRKRPMYLETEKGTDEETGEDWDAINLRKLKDLAR
jgi:deoxyribonuclease-4